VWKQITPIRSIELSDNENRREIEVTDKNIWFLERSIPLFGLLDFFPEDAIGPPAKGQDKSWGKIVNMLKIETDQGWSMETDISSDQKVFRNRSSRRGTGKWVKDADLKAGDLIVIERIDSHVYRLSKGTKDA
jgi:hypothetical protein